MNVPLNIEWQQICLHLLNFAILAGGLYLLMYKPVKKFMDKRTEHYQNMDREAQAKLREAEDLEAEYRARLQKAESEMEQEKIHARQELEQRSIQQLQQAQDQAQQILSDARQRAQQEREKILEDAQKDVAELVTTATEKLLLQATASEAFDQFLTAAERGERHEEE